MRKIIAQAPFWGACLLMHGCMQNEKSPLDLKLNSCQQRSPQSFITAVTQDLGNRPPTSQELSFAKDPSVSRQTLIDHTLESPLYQDAVTKFVTNLFRLAAMPASDDETPGLLDDLKQEPIELVLRHPDKPWSYFFETKEVFCTSRTAALYEYPSSNLPGFYSCMLPEGRAGFLSLVSVLRSTSPQENPQSFLGVNNNYHRASSALYFSTGTQLQSATDENPGQAGGLPLAHCVPTSDVRQTEEGLVYGTAAISLEGAVCASCHSPHLGPLSIAFRPFDPAGNFLTEADIEDNFIDEAGAPMDEIKALHQEQSSCWAPAPEQPPMPFSGLDGLGGLIAKNADLGLALAHQLPLHLANQEASPADLALIRQSFEEGGKTLKAALRGLLRTSRYSCE